MLNEYLPAKCALIEQRLAELIPEKNVHYQQLFEAARYSILGAGKRLRPILALATAEMFGSKDSQALTPACALEMIHTYSLIHDDLPCMDDDDFRRGKPSLHKVYPEGHAVLTGDYLLTYAFDVIAHAENLSPQQRLELIAVLARNSGSDGMIGGQVMDIAAEGKKLDLETLQLLHMNKTGAMITASVEFGAIIGKASKEHRALLGEYAKDIGLAFQIVDDVLDVTASESKHGKAVASDQVNNKTTYVGLIGLEKSRELAQTLTEKAIGVLKQLPFDTTILQEIAVFTASRKN